MQFRSSQADLQVFVWIHLFSRSASPCDSDDLPGLGDRREMRTPLFCDLNPWWLGPAIEWVSGAGAVFCEICSPTHRRPPRSGTDAGRGSRRLTPAVAAGLVFLLVPGPRAGDILGYVRGTLDRFNPRGKPRPPPFNRCDLCPASAVQYRPARAAQLWTGVLQWPAARISCLQGERGSDHGRLI